MGMSLFGTGVSRLEAVAAAREKMHTVHAANIANADTPNYKADKRTFSDFLAAKQSALAITNPSHMDSVSSGRLKESVSTVQRMDGNSVDIQKEMANLAENQMMHELSLRLLKGRLTGLANVIKEGGR